MWGALVFVFLPLLLLAIRRCSLGTRDAIHRTLPLREPISGGTAYWMDDGADTGPMEMRDWCLDAFHLADRVPVQCADPGAADLSYFVFDHDRPS